MLNLEPIYIDIYIKALFSVFYLETSPSNEEWKNYPVSIFFSFVAHFVKNTKKGLVGQDFQI